MRKRFITIQKDLNNLILERVNKLKSHMEVNYESLNDLIVFEKQNKERVEELNITPLTHTLITDYVKLRYNKIKGDEVIRMENILKGVENK